jgi:hypothetical protein
MLVALLGGLHQLPGSGLFGMDRNHDLADLIKGLLGEGGVERGIQRLEQAEETPAVALDQTPQAAIAIMGLGGAVLIDIGAVIGAVVKNDQVRGRGDFSAV